MLAALASGTLIRSPKSGTSASGTKWCNTTIRCSTGTDKEGAAHPAFKYMADDTAFAEVRRRLCAAALGKFKPSAKMTLIELRKFVDVAKRTAHETRQEAA